MKKIIFFALYFYSVFALSQYYNTAKNGLSIRSTPSLKGKKIDIFNYLDYVEIEQKLPNKKLTVNYNGVKTSGYWVEINFKNKPAYVFNGFLKTKLELKKQKTVIDYSAIKVNGKLPYKCKENDFIKALGEPDSIILHVNNYKKHLDIKYQKLLKFKKFEYWDDVECKHYQGNCHNTKTFYENGISYEEFNGEMTLASINFDTKFNYLTYKNQKWDYKTTLNEVINKFPIVNILQAENNNFKTVSPHDHFFSEIKWYMIFNKKNKLLEFGL